MSLIGFQTGHSNTVRMGAGGARSPGDYYDATVPLFGEETTAVKTFDVAFGVVTVVFVIVSADPEPLSATTWPCSPAPRTQPSCCSGH